MPAFAEDTLAAQPLPDTQPEPKHLTESKTEVQVSSLPGESGQIASNQTIEEKGRRGHYFANWATTYSCMPELYFEPQNVHELLQVLVLARETGRRIRVVGGGRSPSDIVCTTDYMISLRHVNRVLHVDKESGLVKVEGGILICDLIEELAKHGLALSVLGSVSDITISGAISTGTHGTGANFGNLSTFVRELELITASGETLTLSRENNESLFLAACVGLGALGIIVSVTFQCEPLYKLHQTQYAAKLEDVLQNLDVHVTASDHFRFVWFPYTDGTVVWHNRRTEKPAFRKSSWFWDYAIGYHLLQFIYWISTFFPSMVPWINPIFYRLLYTKQADLVDRSDKVFCFECLFKQYVNEWSIPREKTALVLFELKAWIENNKFPAHFPIEVRFVKQDDFYISPASGRDSCYINIIMYRPYNKFVAHDKYWRAYERIMKENGGRPHWAKDYQVSPAEFLQMYPNWERFCQIRRQLDPRGMFLNANLERVFAERTY